MSQSGSLSLGVLASSSKRHERRTPIHPTHLARIDPTCRQRIYFERGYGERFGVSDDTLRKQAAGLLEIDELHARCDIVLTAKPTAADIERWPEGLVLWGWPHLVQGEGITQASIDRKLTWIAWEAMNLWPAEGVRGLHVFHKNNELAGYCAILHAIPLLGITGHYGRKRRVALIHYGLTARGAVHALKGLGFADLTCFVRSDPEEVHAPDPGIVYERFEQVEGASTAEVVMPHGARVPMERVLADYDIIVNCVFQDIDRPVFFARESDIAGFRPGAIIVDVSCDTGLGFDFARPTTFDEPFIKVRDAVYYGVDHTPSFLWRSATYELSKALLPYLPVVMGGAEAWSRNPVIAHAVEMREGRILNRKILSAQRRTDEYPHARQS